jgi:hypothetical protein
LSAGSVPAAGAPAAIDTAPTLTACGRSGAAAVVSGLEDMALPIPKARAKATTAAAATRRIWRRW